MIVPNGVHTTQVTYPKFAASVVSKAAEICVGMARHPVLEGLPPGVSVKSFDCPYLPHP
jgi:hypothetical protein